MIELEMGGRRVPVPTGELTLGGDPSCSVALEGVAGVVAVVIGGTDGSVSIRRVGESELLLNGVRLGADPAPMLHGDKLQVNMLFRGREHGFRDRGMAVMQRIKEELGELSKIEREPKMEGNRLVMILSPLTKK